MRVKNDHCPGGAGRGPKSERSHGHREAEQNAGIEETDCSYNIDMVPECYRCTQLHHGHIDFTFSPKFTNMHVHGFRIFYQSQSHFFFLSGYVQPGGRNVHVSNECFITITQ